MNVADSEIILGILSGDEFEICAAPDSADAVFLNTCAVRENAEQRIIGRLAHYRSLRKTRPRLVLGVLGCMAERLKSRLIEEQGVNVVCGPDEYRRLPELIDGAFAGQAVATTHLSKSETYEDIMPKRAEGVGAWIPVMRGCDKFCSYCVVPFTRGRERSRGMASVLREVEELSERGFREVTLLGQNVNSWRDDNHDFADLITAASRVNPELRIRFATSHPQDLSPKLIQAIAENENICKALHLPAQSGSDRILNLMNRSYTSTAYLSLLNEAKSTIERLAVSTDIIAGFPTETEDDHKRTLELMEAVRFDSAFTFIYSPRENTRAWKMGDDVPGETKNRRLQEIIDLQRRHSLERNRELIGRVLTVPAEGPSKRSAFEWIGRTDGNKTVVFPHGSCKPGDMVRVRIDGATSATLSGSVIPDTIDPAEA